MKNELEQVLFSDSDNMLDELQALIDSQPKESRERKALINLRAYLMFTTEPEQDLLYSPASMAAASLRATGLINDTGRDESLTALILQSAIEAWLLVNGQQDKENLN
ncbi:hypothetical protein [Sporomusa acidovorans]|uniref:Bacteriocin immunity protein n=1 Tax=Sporomusa acidovorans (strain ATCC 49682 / DSM 3132 / Mol) TaxID=1123286 RepID=A0ABZ3IWB5_SPOA4|nr:hypothetical protein [Sporomusa acidovorans]OZC23660.1 hypothetical protein SPACI_05620 [Sporomusa acidovorans DSM 3132]SDE24168.1 hypothetical protein SAMN04488499_101088 [Sporomusa acidovorans]